MRMGKAMSLADETEATTAATTCPLLGRTLFTEKNAGNLKLVIGCEAEAEERHHSECVVGQSGVLDV